MSERVAPVFDLVAIDIETTGLDPKQNEIVEITAIEFNSSGLTGQQFTQLCKPVSGYIPIEASDIHGITYDMVKECPTYFTDKIREKVAEFVGDRIVVGHNIMDFDLKFIRINFSRIKDTLIMCRSKFKSGNKLELACKRAGISWEASAAHRSKYDTLKCIELYCKLTQQDKPANVVLDLFKTPEEIKNIYSKDSSFAQTIKDINFSDNEKLGVTLSEQDKSFLSSQVYSYSRINLFNQCPFKWYMQYIKGYKESQKDYLQTGQICHSIAEWAGEWCYKQTFINKFIVYISNKKIPDNAPKNPKDFAEYIYKNQNNICVYFPDIKNIANLIYDIDKTISSDSYEKPSMPDLETYNGLIDKAIIKHKCEDVDVIADVKHIMNRYYTLKDFTLLPGDLILTEKKIVFDKDWNPLDDFSSPKAFFRAVIDVVNFFGDTIVITDYKSSRKMLTLKQMKEDYQTLIYALLIYKFLPKNSFKKMILKIDYIRYGETVAYEIDNIEEIAKKALEWINMSIQNIEKEVLKTDGTAFQPIRNEYCHSCSLAVDGICPLFKKIISEKIENPLTYAITSADDCVTAWKKIEVNSMENARLISLCKAFVEKNTGSIIIDKKAKLDFYLSKHREFDVRKTIVMLLEKKLNMNDFIKYFKISSNEFQQLIEDIGLQLTDKEIDSISTVKSRYTFDAFTEKESQEKGFINS